MFTVVRDPKRKGYYHIYDAEKTFRGEISKVSGGYWGHIDNRTLSGGTMGVGTTIPTLKMVKEIIANW